MSEVEEDNYFHGFRGEVITVDFINHPETAESLISIAEEKLSKAKVVGLDLEWTPDTCKLGELNEEFPGNPVALVQIAIPEFVLLFRTISVNDLPSFLREILTSDSVVKVTVGFDLCDRLKLRSSLNCDCSCVVDLGEWAGALGLPCRGLKSLATYFGYQMRKSKKIAMSDWGSSEQLSSSQIGYAAEDAWFNLLIASKMAEKGPFSENLEISTILPSVVNLEGFIKKIPKTRGDSSFAFDVDEVLEKLRRNFQDEEVVGRSKKRRKMETPNGWISADSLGVPKEFFEINSDLFEIKNGKVRPRVLPAARECNVEGILGIFSEYPPGYWLTDRVLKKSLNFQESLGSVLSGLVTDGLLQNAWDGERKLKIYKLSNHPRASSRERIENILMELLEVSDSISKFLNCNFEDLEIGSVGEEAMIFSIAAKIKISRDAREPRGEDGDYRKRELNFFIKDLRQKWTKMVSTVSL